MYKRTLHLLLFLLVYTVNLNSQIDTNYSVTTEIDTSLGCRPVFVLNKNKIPVDSFFCGGGELLSYYISNEDTISILYGNYSEVKYAKFTKNNDQWHFCHYTSGIIWNFPQPGMWIEEIHGDKNRPTISEMEFEIEGIDIVKIKYSENVSYVDFDKKIAARKKWLAKMAAIRTKRLEKEK